MCSEEKSVCIRANAHATEGLDVREGPAICLNVLTSTTQTGRVLSSFLDCQYFAELSTSTRRRALLVKIDIHPGKSMGNLEIVLRKNGYDTTRIRALLG